MSSIQSFKDLYVWQKAKVLSLDIYNEFQDISDRSFVIQIQRAVISIMNNIAEGYARRSDKALKNFLFISLGSAAEVESMLHLAVELGYVNQVTQERLLLEAEEVMKLLNAFIRKLTAIR